jgi:hypothetical protein
MQRMSYVLMALVLLCCFGGTRPAEAICVLGMGNCSPSIDEFNPADPTHVKNLTKESFIAFLQFMHNGQCFQLPLGRIHVKPFSQRALVNELNGLKEAGIITFANANTSSGNALNDIASHIGQEIGEGDLDVSLMPSVGPEHFTKPGCLKMSTIKNISFISWEVQTFQTKRTRETKQVTIGQGTYDETDYDPLYLAYQKTTPYSPIEHGKFRVIYEYDPFRKLWGFDGEDVGDITGPFRGDTVGLVLGQ